MDQKTLHNEYLLEGTAGFAVIRKFYFRYADVLTTASLYDINDVVHEVFLSLSKTNFAQINNVEHYLMRAIKLHCWSILDKAIRRKTVIVNGGGKDESDGKEINDGKILPFTNPDESLIELEGLELLSQVILFKTQLNSNETRLLNLLIDEVERDEIAKKLGFNMNTLDTNIRRLRMKLAEYLKSLGYTYRALNRFS